MTDDEVAEVLNRSASATASEIARGQGWKVREVGEALERLVAAGRAQRVGHRPNGAYTYDPPPDVLYPDDPRFKRVTRA